MSETEAHIRHLLFHNFDNIIKATIMDLAIFHNSKYPDKECDNHESCISILRLISSLKYYSSLNVSQSTKDQNLFMNFIKEVYTHQILDDYHHFSKSHGNSIQDILQFAKRQGNLKSCNINQCAYSDRLTVSSEWY